VRATEIRYRYGQYAITLFLGQWILYTGRDLFDRAARIGIYPSFAEAEQALERIP
jgi:hypothetical protein